MIQKFFKTLLVASLLMVATQIEAKCKSTCTCTAFGALTACTAFCALTVKNIEVEGDASISGTLTVAGVPFNSLAIIAGAIGAVGPAGAQGIQGVLGAIGAAGAAGAPGTAGLPGIPGIGGALNWGYIYNVTPQTIAIGATVPFDSNGPLSGVTHTPGSDTIVVTGAGVYVFFFTVTAAQSSQFALAINGTEDQSTIYGSGSANNTGQAILALGAGASINLVAHRATAPVTLSTPVSGTQNNVNAAVLIIRIA